jgi:hypothetical protein
MSLVAVLAQLRARHTVNPRVRAGTALKSGLTVEARANGTWLLSRHGVRPSNRECEIIARDARISTGFRVSGGPGKNPQDLNVYRLVTPLEDLPECATLKLCPHCEERSLVDTVHDGMGEICLRCTNDLARAPMPQPASVTPNVIPNLTMAEHAGFQDYGESALVQTPLGVAMRTIIETLTAKPDANDADPSPTRADYRPGIPLRELIGMRPIKVNQIYHFEAFGALFGVSVDLNHKYQWAALEPIDGPHGGYQSGSLEDFRRWFEAHGRFSSELPPERWRGFA